ncbi:aa3 type cytochrome c oxidase subunit IV [Aliiroseovarius halocynthiae]|uniref:Aa3-type cytochrome c oxidase subunit IV n=1 Tax=Aliiroseovarius halocynthiae TaxID=985055 RepID=A0A545SNF5_9RHOB|nr:aa3-type cytochrome c oxidase subunit IV [Aliiroseovarius halocynthiae]TQV66386.1 aa3-type cytochrome c oxidase subunit IV [Aliiroseovarius halocynthiae]SMR83363.1 aa3 type cytochrome c oxidase subunit IV [Aliiroseovarius halocynthiae]
MAEHVHGTMETGAQEKTYAGFVAVTKWSVIFILAVLVFLAIVGA